MGQCMTLIPSFLAFSARSLALSSIFVSAITPLTASCSLPPSVVNSFWNSMKRQAVFSGLRQPSLTCKPPLAWSGGNTRFILSDEHHSEYLKDASNAFSTKMNQPRIFFWWRSDEYLCFLQSAGRAQLTLQTNCSAVWLSFKKDSAWTMCTHDVQNDSIKIAQQALTAQQ